jgi:GntR family transcriptional regulator
VVAEARAACRVRDDTARVGDVLEATTAHGLAIHRLRGRGDELSGTVTAEALTHAPLYRQLADAGVELDRVEHEITAEVAGPRNAQLLDVAIGAALMRVNRLAFAGGKPHHALSILLSPNRSRILLAQTGAELDAGDGLSIAHDVRGPVGH